MPAGGPLHVPARLDRAALDAFVLPDLDFLRLLRTLLFGPRCHLRLVQRRVRRGSRRLRLRLARLALRELALALLFLRQVRGLPRRQLLVPALLFLAELRFARIDRRRGRTGRLRRRTRLCVALDEDALLLDLDLDGARFAARIGLLDDLGGLLARQRDLVLGFR